MRGPICTVLAALVFVASAGSAPAQKFQPKSILFQGDPEYSNAELLEATGLKNDAVLSYADMQVYSKRLLDSGVFASVAFKFDGQDLTFMLAPSTDLCTVRLENIPLAPGENPDAKIHDRVPLYHGKVPTEGGINDDVRVALEKMLAAEGLEATVAATTASDPSSHIVNTVSYSVTAPPVMAAVTHIEGASVQLQSRLQAVMAEAAKNPYSTSGSADNLARVIEQFYEDMGFAAAKVEVARAGNATLQSGAIVVPLSVHVEEGRIYQVTAVHLPPGTPVTQQEIDKALAASIGGPSIGVRIRSIWELISVRYKSKGYLDCKVTPQAVFHDADSTMSYNVDVDPGPVYHLGFVKFDNVTDELRTLLIRNWQMLPGDPFDPNYVATFIFKAQQQDPVLARSLVGVKAAFSVMANPDTHDVNVLIRLEKQ